MKNTFFKITLFLAIFTATTGFAQNNTLRKGIGPVEKIQTTVEKLPQPAQTFINNLFPDTSIKSVYNDLIQKEYEVDMASGYEITFDSNGNWIEIEAPDNATFPRSFLTRLIADTPVVETLSSDIVYPGGVIDYVESVAYIPDFGYLVEYEVTDYTKGKLAIDNSGNIQKNKNCKANNKKASSSAKDKHSKHKGKKR